MLVIENTEHFRIESPTIVTIGTFDGIHLGHQKILNRLNELKKTTGLKTVVFTFEPHPRKVLFPEQKDLKLLNSTPEKLELLEQMGIDVAVVFPFNKTFAQMDVETYISHVLIKELNVKHLVIGYDHKFGINRSGDINTLIEYSPKYNFLVEEISVKDIDHIAISSSKIRKHLEDGNVEMVNTYLGHHYILNGTVVKGKQLGRQLGYPTANLLPDSTEKLIPKPGVYFTEVLVNNRHFFGMLNIGTNPTTDTDNGIKIEVHLLDFNEDIYHQPIRLTFLKRLRDEKKFNGLAELMAAIEQDEADCRQLIKTTSTKKLSALISNI
ncbi:MAG: bifunctional riboflavin kinase/FAD synthetase [Bacteroidia bacterium]|nr:bifunctional riboflavin kinase/FAD synthetase [Bacteroidia bacterium]